MIANYTKQRQWSEISISPLQPESTHYSTLPQMQNYNGLTDLSGHAVKICSFLRRN